MEGLTLQSFGLIWVTLTLLSFGQVLLKLGIGPEGVPTCSNPVKTAWAIIRVFLRPKTAAGMALYVVGTFIWLFVLSRVPLSIAFPLFSMSYFLVVILSATILREKVAWRFAIVGLVFISIGVTFFGLSSPRPSRQEAAGAAHSTKADTAVESAHLRHN